MTDFVHLHVHTEYSLLDGLAKIDKLVRRVKELEMEAVAITDHGAMYGVIDFYKECKAAGIKPLIGMEGYVVNRDHQLKEGRGDKENFHLGLLAKDYNGYRNLMQLATIAHKEGYYYRPRVDKATLARFGAGLICLSGCPRSEIGQLLIEDNYPRAKEVAGWYQEVFGEDYYLEIQRHQAGDYLAGVKDNPRLTDRLNLMATAEQKWVAGVVRLSRELGIPLVATNDVHYIDQADATAQDALVCISTGKNVAEIDRLRYVDIPTLHLRSSPEMADIFADLPDSLKNTQSIADKINVHISLGKWYFPNIDIPPGLTAPDYLRQQALDGLAQRYSHPPQQIWDRLNFELEVIVDKGYAPYFLMMADLVKWCTDHGVITNTRGSAAGSIVSYVLGITTVDPIKHALPFERFLNPLRPKPPDIDLDVADDRREEVIAYIVAKYGADKVAQICTFGRMLARAAVRDVGRVLGHPYSFPDRMAKLVPLGSQGFPMTVKKALDLSPELTALASSDPAAKQILDLAAQIEGNARHASVHAAGIVISPGPMTDYSPLQLEPNGTKVITQYEMHACEDVGLVKFDILGIRHLSILGAAVRIIAQTQKAAIDLAHLPLDDQATFNMLARGETMGVFQLGGTGMTKWLKELKPNRLEDIMVMIALFRPGPMANIPEYIARKHGKSPVTYLHPKMAKFLDKSYGLLVYQEDVLLTALELAGYTWETVDKLREAIGKKIPSAMAKQHDIFVAGCQKTSGLTAEKAESLWQLFVPFQGYGFNKAHAASYGIVSFQTAYLKAHYPVEYMTALLTAESGNTEKVVEAIEECRRTKISVLGPDINESDTGFSPVGETIRFGLSAIKNVGEAAIGAILAARQAGPFTSFTDFCLRVDSQKVNRKVVESLIKAGSMDSFGHRSALLASLDQIRSLGTTISKLKSSGQTTLFDPSSADRSGSDILPDIAEFDLGQKLAMEKQLLGFYLSQNPHAQALEQMGRVLTHRLADLQLENLTGQRVVTGGVIESCRNVITKNAGQQMCFAKITDQGKSVEAVVFPKIYATDPGLWQPDNLVVVSGRVESRQEEEVPEGEIGTRDVTLVVDSAVLYTGPQTELPAVSAPAVTTTSVSIFVPQGVSSAKLVKLNSLLQEHKGHQPALLVFAGNGGQKTLSLPFGLKWTPSLAAKISSLW